MAIFPINKNLVSASGNNIIEVLNVAQFLNKLKAQYPAEYWLDINCILESLDLASNLSTTTLPEAPIPAIEAGENKAAKATKIADIWRQYPSVGLQLYFDPGNGIYQKKGQAVIIQNTPIQLPIPLISPYLNVTANIFLLGETSRIGIQLLSGGNYKSIAGSDYISITGALRIAIEPRQKEVVPIRVWNNISSTLVANTATKVLEKNLNRRYLTVQNAGTSDCYVGFGNQITNRLGNLLTPKGSLNLDFGKYYTEAELWGYCPTSDGLIVGQEGLI